MLSPPLPVRQHLEKSSLPGRACSLQPPKIFPFPLLLFLVFPPPSGAPCGFAMHFGARRTQVPGLGHRQPPLWRDAIPGLGPAWSTRCPMEEDGEEAQGPLCHIYSTYPPEPWCKDGVPRLSNQVPAFPPPGAASTVAALGWEEKTGEGGRSHAQRGLPAPGLPSVPIRSEASEAVCENWSEAGSGP